MSGNLAGGVNDFLYGKANTIAEVENIAFAAVHQVIHSKNMCLSQVGHMDVVTNTGAVLGVVVVTKDGDELTLAIWHLQNQRNQMGFRVVCLTDFAGDMGAAGIEIPQRHEP